MSFSVGIIGLPNVGKSTLFKALTKKEINIADYPFTTIHPNFGVVTVPDERLEKIAKIIQPEKVTPTAIEFVDIAGLVKGAHKGEGLGNQFLAQIRNCAAVLEVVRGFENEKVENVLGKINPKEEIGIIKTELLMKDLETLEGIIQKTEKDEKKDKFSSSSKMKNKFSSSSKMKNKNVFKKIELIKKIKTAVSQEKLISGLDLADEEKEIIKEYQFLTEKPILHILNTNGKTFWPKTDVGWLEINLKEEKEASELSLEEKNELGFVSQLDQIIKNCYHILDLITFFTIAGGKETRAWTIKKGSKAPQAGGMVHSDFEEKFIRAEIIDWKLLVETGNWKEAKESGKIKTVGHDYIVEDGDIIEFKI